jgi:ketosteroid isomerase-like protein
VAHPNEELARKGYEAFAKGDMDTLNDLFADDIKWHAPGRGPLSGDYNGKQEVFDVFAKVFELSGGTFNLELHDVLANDEHVATLLTAKGERNGKKLASRGVQVFHVKDGKVTESWLHSEDQFAVDEFFS